MTHSHSWTAVVLKSMTNNLPHPLQSLVTSDCWTNDGHYLHHQSGVWEARGLSGQGEVTGDYSLLEFRELEGVGQVVPLMLLIMLIVTRNYKEVLLCDIVV